MNVATIVDVRPTGEEPFPGQYGILYPFLVTFDDNTSGKANCKTMKPPYKAGDKVGYEVTGQFKGKNNIKITKNPDKPFTQAPQVQPPYQSAAAREQETPGFNAGYPKPIAPVAGRPGGPSEIEAINPVFGATVGMAMNQAIQVLTQNLEHDELVERIIRPDFWYSVHEVASDVIRVARELEKGRLAPSPTERAKRSGEAKKGLPAHPDSHPDLEPADETNVPF